MGSAICQTKDTGDGTFCQLDTEQKYLQVFRRFTMGAKPTNAALLFLALKVGFLSNLTFYVTQEHVETRNVINNADGGYEWVLEYIPIAQPNGATLAKIDALKPTKEYGDRASTL